MNKFTIKLMALALGFALSAGSMAQTLSKDDYKTGKDKIGTEYKSAKGTCIGQTMARFGKP